MKKILKLIVFLLLAFISIAALSWFTDKSRYGIWAIEKKSGSDTGLSWIKFEWVGDSLGKKYFERMSMNIPAKIDNLPYNFTFQFDLGDQHTEIYEGSLNALYAADPAVENKVEGLKGIVQFWNKNRSDKSINIQWGDYFLKSPDCYVRRNFGEAFDKDSVLRKRPIHIGSIGVDVFQNKVLIIDYPARQFTIVDSVPENYKIKMVPIKLNNAGMVLLPMTLNGKTYDCQFDNGSSIFQLIGSSSRINEYSKANDNDTIPVSPWGTVHNMTGKRIEGTIEIGGQKFDSVEIYADHRKEVQESLNAPPYLVTGNALFWNKTIIIDFRHKQFGVQ